MDEEGRRLGKNSPEQDCGNFWLQILMISKTNAEMTTLDYQHLEKLTEKINGLISYVYFLDAPAFIQ